MLLFIFVIIIIASIFLIVSLYENKNKGHKSPAVLDNPFSEQEIKRRKEHLNKTLIYAQKKQKITPKDVEKDLKISRDDAIRYLEHLTSFGKITKVNERGQEVYYQING